MSLAERKRSKIDEQNELQARILAELSNSNFPRLRRLDVEVRGDAAILHGQVGSYHERQVAVALAERECGPIPLIDRLQVTPATPPSQPAP